MNIIPLGKIAVPTPGTTVRVTADETIKVHSVTFVQIPGAVGVTSIKNAAGTIFRQFLPSGSSGPDSDAKFHAESGNLIKLADFYVDAATAGEGLYVYYSVV